MAAARVIEETTDMDREVFEYLGLP